ncbi:hypothetical protein BJY04DRAFT_127434 [Aspergillus karnatakaensis]|uniref:uncharacterized protein n=1 Tax=Aspergillus karnatakaensis TaxID=1810916 RepID=UPI003CCD030B
MPRRNRMAAYDNVVDDMEYQPYSRRTKGEPLFDMDARYGQRIPHEPVQEILERRHVREKVKPEIPRESYEYLEDDAMAADRLSRLDLNAYSPESINNYVKQRISGRQARGRPPSSDSGDDDDAFFSPEEAKELYTESGSDSDEIEEYIENKKRTGTRHKPEVRKEHLPRSKQVKEEKRSRRAVIEEPVFTKSSRSVEESTRERKGPRVAARPRPQHRSHYDLGLEEEDDETESDESDDEIIETIPKPSRRRVTKRDRVERKYSTQKGDVSSSSSILSSSESLGSSESELPKVPLPIPIPPIHKDSPRRHKSLGHGKDIRGPFTTAAPPLAETGFQIPSPPSPPTPPRVPSLETVLSEREARKRLEKAAKGVVEVERRSKETLVLPPEPPAPPAPPAPPVRRKKEKPVTIVETPEPVGHTGSRVRDERGGPRASFERREIIEEEDYYRSRDPRWSSPSSGATDDWAIVHAPPRQRKSPAKEVVDVREERQSRRKQQLSRAPEVEDGELRPKGERRSRSKPGPRYIGVRDRKERLWTEITKDLVVKEAIERAGLEYEEMDSVYYIFAYLHPVRVSLNTYPFYDLGLTYDHPTGRCQCPCRRL